MADGDRKLIPVGPLMGEPVYSDAHVIHQAGVIMTVWFLRLPPTFSEGQIAARETATPGETHSPTVAAVTMPGELALKLADSIYRLAGKTPPEA
jgi:hypothetical protein